MKEAGLTNRQIHRALKNHQMHCNDEGQFATKTKNRGITPKEKSKDN